MIFSGLNKTDLINYPGNIAATVFTRGCNFRCPYCHNPSLVLPEEQSDSFSEEEILDYIKSRSNFLDAVVVSGGEPTLHDGISFFLLKVKNLGLLTKLDTNGTNPDVVEFLLNGKLIDYVAVDLKTSFASYDRVCPENAVKAVENLKKTVSLLRSSGIDYEFRTTCVPTVVSADDLESLASFVLPSEKWYLQPFNPKITLDPAFGEIAPFAEKDLEALVLSFRQRGLNVSLRV